MLRICLVCQLFPPFGGGAAALLGVLASRLAERGHQVEVYTAAARDAGAFAWPRKGPRVPSGPAPQDGYLVRRIRPAALSYTAVRRLARWPLPGFPPLVREAWRTAGPWLPGLGRKIRDFAPQVLVAAPLPALVCRHARQAAERCGAPFVLMPCLHFHDGWPSLASVREELGRADRVAPFTEAEADFVRAAGVPARQVRVIPGCAPGQDLLPPYAEPGEQPRVVMLGRLALGKRWGVLAEAYSRLAAEIPELGLDLVGRDSAESPQVRALFRQLPGSAAERVRFHVDVDDEEKASILRRAWMLALPSLAESFGLVLLEAWRAGRPVVVPEGTAQGSLVRPGVDGLLHRPDSASSLAEAIRRLVADPALARGMGRAGRERFAAEFTAAAFADRYEELLRELV